MRPFACALALAVILPLALGAQVPATDLAALHLQQADRLLADGRHPEAVEAYARAKGSGEPALEIRAMRGLVHAWSRLAEFRRAWEEATALLALAPDDPEATAIAADALWAAGRFGEAEAAFRRSLDLDEANARARNGLARALAASNQLESALAEAQTAIRLAPRESEFHYTVGAIYRRLRQYDDAAGALEQYVGLLPRRLDSAATWGRHEVRVLRSFGQREPLSIDGDEPVHRLAFRQVGNKIVLPGQINGGSPVDFVLDTGSELTLLSLATARRAGVTPIGRTLSAGVGQGGLHLSLVGRIDSLQFGSLTIRNIPCLVKPTSPQSVSGGDSQIFSPLALELSMRIDYERQELIIGAELPPGPSEVELPLRYHRLPVVEGLLNGDYPASFVVDTGGEAVSISAAAAGDLPPWDGRRIPLKVYGTSGWDPDAFLLPGVDLELETIRLPRLSVVVLDLRAPSRLIGLHLGGILGHRFLSRYTVTFDRERSLLGLSRASSAATPLP
jgi:tetratricopeptide (TPR) repeat protein